MSDNGIEIELMHIGTSFDVSVFYQVCAYPFRRWQKQQNKTTAVSGCTSFAFEVLDTCT